MSKVKLPQRTCVSCRKTAFKGDLQRFVLLRDESCAEADGDDRENGWLVKADPEQRLQGRGVYCHPTGPCSGAKNLQAQILHSLLKSRRKKYLRGSKTVLVFGIKN